MKISSFIETGQAKSLDDKELFWFTLRISKIRAWKKNFTGCRGEWKVSIRGSLDEVNFKIYGYVRLDALRLLRHFRALLISTIRLFYQRTIVHAKNGIWIICGGSRKITVCSSTLPHSTEIFRKYCKNTSWKYCKTEYDVCNILKILPKLANA